MLYGSGGSGIGGDDTYGTTNPRMRSRVSSQAVLPIVLVGTSLGGAIAAAFTAAYPSEVSRLVLVAPAGLIPVSNLPCVSQIHRRGRVGRAVQAVIETCCGCCAREYLRLQYERLRWANDVAADVRRPGFIQAYWSTVKHFTFSTMHGTFRAVGSGRGGTVGGGRGGGTGGRGGRGGGDGSGVGGMGVGDGAGRGGGSGGDLGAHPGGVGGVDAFGGNTNSAAAAAAAASSANGSINMADNDDRLPVLIIWGDEDGMVPLDESILNLIPHARLVVIEGCGHEITMGEGTVGLRRLVSGTIARFARCDLAAENGGGGDDVGPAQQEGKGEGGALVCPLPSEGETLHVDPWG